MHVYRYGLQVAVVTGLVACCSNCMSGWLVLLTSSSTEEEEELTQQRNPTLYIQPPCLSFQKNMIYVPMPNNAKPKEAWPKIISRDFWWGILNIQALLCFSFLLPMKSITGTFDK